MTGKMDLRTQAGRRDEILAQVQENGGFSVFWVTENTLRAHVAGKMTEDGEITVTPLQFPWYDVTIHDGSARHYRARSSAHS